jgi:hypothetical protein
MGGTLSTERSRVVGLADDLVYDETTIYGPSASSLRRRRHQAVVLAYESGVVAPGDTASE